MRPLGEIPPRLARRAVALAETRRGAGIVFAAGLAVWWLQALIMPLGAGRDLGTYLGAYVQLFQSHPIDLGYVLGRTPVASLVVGGLLDLAGGALAEPVVSLLYAGSILAWFLVARRFGGRAALLTAIVLLAYPGYGILFHELSSDAVFAAAFAAWALLTVRVVGAPTVRGFALVGAGVGVLTLIRPGNEILLVLAVVPLLLRTAWRARVLSALAFLAPAIVLILGWVVHNGIRYDNYTLARGGNATVPFFRTFVTDKLVRPSNGTASRELARAVQRDLLPKQPYRAYGITLDDFFREASPRMQVDLLTLSDRIKGWHSNYRWLRDVGVEAARTHPGSYARGVASSTWGLLTQGLYRTPSAGGSGGVASTESAGGGAAATVSGSLPKPTEGEPIPAPHEGGVTTPDGSIYTVWTSPTEHHLVFVHPGDAERYDALHHRMSDLAGNLPDRAGSAALTRRLNQASRWFPPSALWLALGLVALLLRRPKRMAETLIPAVAGLAVIVLSALGLPAEPHYSLPVAPAFVFLAAGALFAPRTAPSASWRKNAAAFVPSRRVAGMAVGIAAAAWAAEIYVSKLHRWIGTGGAAHDLDVFLSAAGKVVHGSSPYAFNGDQTYAYPPLLAFLAAPLHPLSAGTAAAIWLVLSLAAIAVALWLLGLRDWRCYALVAVYPFARSALDLGTVGPLLLLLVAIAWRWRDRVLPPAAALGAAVALKLFLWPLFVWLFLTRRVRATFAAVGLAVGLAVLPWAAIGFADIGGYPGLLHRLSNEEATSSYSVIALGVRAHLPESVAVALSLVAAAALLGLAAWAGRDARRSPHDRDVAVLTLCLAAALAASPIVWVHYFLLLLVPLALTRPRLSPLWFLPFVYYPLGESAWPAGDARKLGIALVATVVLLVGALLRVERAADQRVRLAVAMPRARRRASGLQHQPR